MNSAHYLLSSSTVMWYKDRPTVVWMTVCYNGIIDIDIAIELYTLFTCTVSHCLKHFRTLVEGWRVESLDDLTQDNYVTF